MCKILPFLIFLGTSVALADETQEKRAASLPGVLVPLAPSIGLSTGLSLPQSAVPKSWLTQLQPLKSPTRNLLLPTPLPLEALLVVGPTWYSLKWREGGRHVVFMARYSGFTLAGFDAPQISPSEISISRSHGLVSADVNFEGAAVTLDVECSEPAKDPACSADDHLRQRILNLALLR